MVREPQASPPAEWVGDHLAPVRRRLHEDFADLPADTIDHCFAAEMMRFEGCRITAFVPILIDKNVRARLRAMQLKGSATFAQPEPAVDSAAGGAVRVAR